jgi:predicted nuclease with TOPRIM domain
MWDILFSNLPMVILIIIALFFCTIEVIKGVQFFKELKNKKVNEVVEERQQEIDMQAEFNKLHERFDEIQDELKTVKERLAVAEQQLKDLTISDMHDIKSWIVEQYHKFYVQQGWIDAFSAETIDRRYSDYKKEGGNSYIKTLIDQLHTLSMDPEQNIHKDKK